MKFLRGVVYSILQGTNEELLAVKDLLTFESKPSYLNDEGVLYTGLIDFVQEKLGDRFLIELEDMEPSVTEKIAIRDIHIPDDYIKFDNPDHRIRPYQLVACRKALYKKRGIIEIATGGGKTEIAAIIIKYLLEHNLAKKIYVVAGTCFLMEQAYERFALRGLTNMSCMGSGNKFKPAAIQVCVVDSLTAGVTKNQEVMDDFASADCIIFDEAHHLKAETWTHLGELCQAPYRYGLTATLWADPTQYSHEDFFLIGLTGGIVCSIPSSVLRSMGYLADPLVTILDVNIPIVEAKSWDNIYQQGIVDHKTRNSLIMSVAEALYNGKYKSLIFVKYISHGLSLMKQLRELGCKNTFFVKGGKKLYTWLPSGRFKVETVSTSRLSEMVNDTDSSIVIGSQVLDEGVDIPSFNALIMGSAMKKYRRTVQRAGRGMRPKPGENKVYLFDFHDYHCRSLNEHSAYREQTYRLEEFEVSTSLQHTEDRMGVKFDMRENLFRKEKIKVSEEDD